MSFSKILTCKGQVFICQRPPPLLGFCLGSSSNFVNYESGQIQSVKLMQFMVSNKTRHPPTPHSHKRKISMALKERRVTNIEL
jgi:hypothetical protein